MDWKDRYLAEGEFGKDHWSTLAYIETVMVDCGGFQVGLDAHMRQNRRHWRVMAEQCASPKRTNKIRPAANRQMAAVMDAKHSTVLPSGEIVNGHDDWCCVQDMANAGYFTIGADEIKPGVILHLSNKGREVALALRSFKSGGGSFGTFTLAA